jgi:hypothetical protein
MRIHTSSLTLTPAGYNRTHIGTPDVAQNNDHFHLEQTSKETHKDSGVFTSGLPSEDEIKQISKSPLLNPQFKHLENPENGLNSKVLKALSAYSQEFNTPLRLDDPSRTASIKIDTYA